MPSTDIGIALQRSLRRLTRITVVLILAVLALGVYVYVDSGNKRDELARQAQRTAVQSAQTTRAICTLRAELQRRVVESVEFLAKHPDGIPGISARTLQSSIANTQQTVKALSSLKCG